MENQMNKVEISKWQVFRITDVFDVSNTNSILSRDVVKDSGIHPYLTASSANNGVSSWIEYKNELLEKGNCIFIGGKTLVITYQPSDFFSNDSHNLALRMKDTANATEEVQLFFVTILRKTLEQRYQWSDSISVKAIKEDEPVIWLPVTNDGKIDYGYMASFITKKKMSVKDSLGMMQRACRIPKKTVSISTWRDFIISDLFDIVKGTRLTKKDMRMGGIRYIGASAVNNGITAYIANDTDLHPANTITVAYDGSVGASFYQDKPFWASDAVNVLYPKFALNRDIAMFIIPIITKVGKEKYEFRDKWKKEYMEKDAIKLPATSDGQPDFAYMERTIKEMTADVHKHFALLNEIAK